MTLWRRPPQATAFSAQTETPFLQHGLYLSGNVLARVSGNVLARVSGNVLARVSGNVLAQAKRPPSRRRLIRTQFTHYLIQPYLVFDTRYTSGRNTGAYDLSLPHKTGENQGNHPHAGRLYERPAHRHPHRHGHQRAHGLCRSSRRAPGGPGHQLLRRHVPLGRGHHHRRGHRSLRAGDSHHEPPEPR